MTDEELGRTIQEMCDAPYSADSIGATACRLVIAELLAGAPEDLDFVRDEVYAAIWHTPEIEGKIPPQAATDTVMRALSPLIARLVAERDGALKEENKRLRQVICELRAVVETPLKLASQNTTLPAPTTLALKTALNLVEALAAERSEDDAGGRD